MATVRILNTDNIQGLFVEAEDAKNAANEATARALEAAQAAAEAAGRVASFDELLPAVLAILRAEIGSGVNYIPRGPWLPTETYKINHLVSFTLPDGSIRSFIATADPPVGTPPTDTGFWGLYGETPTQTDPRLELAVNLAAPLNLAPGASSGVQLTLTTFYAADPELVFVVSSDEPGLTGTVALQPDAGDALDEGTVEEDDALGDGGARPTFYALTLAAGASTPEGQYSVTVSARSKSWVNDPTDLNYGLRSDAKIDVVVSSIGVVPASDATATYKMSSGAYALADFLADTGPNGLTLIRKGDVRPNSRGDGWFCEGSPGSALCTPPLTGHTLNAAQELTFIPPDPTALAPGTVVAALASTTRKHDYAYVYTTAEGFKLRTAKQNAAGTGADTLDSEPLAYAGGTRFSLSVDPATSAVRVQSWTGRGVAVPLPAWPASGVRGSFYGVLLADETVLLPGVGEVLAATVHRTVLSAARRSSNAQWLAENCTKRALQDARAEFPPRTRLILAMQPGGETKDRTFYDPATHNLVLMGDAAAGQNGGVVTSGAAGSAARTGWLTDVTWAADFTAAFYVDNFFADPQGISYISLNSENAENEWVKLYPAPVTTSGVTSYDALFSVLSEPGPARKVRLTGIGNLPGHLFLLHYNAATRTISVLERFSGRSSGDVSVFDTYLGQIGLTLGGGYFGKKSDGTYKGLSAIEATASRHAGVWIGAKLYTAAEEKAALDALGVSAAVLAPSGGEGVPGIPTGGPTTPDPAVSTLVGVQDFNAERLGSGELRSLFDTRIKNGFFYLPNSKRKNPIGDHVPWDKSYVNRYEIKSYGGKSYRSYTGPDAGIYHMGRGTSKISYTTLHAFRATKDLRILDVACAEVDSLMRTAKDESGINSTEPDGFLGFAYGVNGHRQIFFGPGDSRNTAQIANGQIEYANAASRGNAGMTKMTGIEMSLEEGLMISWMTVALAAHQNMDKFSPTYEPVGNRPATPQYYRAVRDRATKIYEDTCDKWDKYFQNKRESELPMNIRRTLAHPLLNEIASKIAYAKIKGGADWKTHAAYKEAGRAWKLALGPLEKVGVGKLHNACWHVASHPRWGKCVYWSHQFKRFAPGSTKDSSGEYITRDEKSQYVHLNDYVSDDYGSMIFMHEEGADFVTKEWLGMVANTVLATMTIGDKFERNGRYGPVPKGMHGNNYVPELVSPWGQSKSTDGTSTGLLTGSTLAGLAAYSPNYDAFSKFIKDAMSRWASSVGDQSYGGWTGLLLAAAKREGKI